MFWCSWDRSQYQVGVALNSKNGKHGGHEIKKLGGRWGGQGAIQGKKFASTLALRQAKGSRKRNTLKKATGRRKNKRPRGGKNVGGKKGKNVGGVGCAWATNGKTGGRNLGGVVGRRKRRVPQKKKQENPAGGTIKKKRYPRLRLKHKKQENKHPNSYHNHVGGCRAKNGNSRYFIDLLNGGLLTITPETSTVVGRTLDEGQRKSPYQKRPKSER